VSSSRSSALAARALGIPSFIICDYEFVDLRAYRRLGSYLLFPEVIPAAVFEELGFAATRLLPFRGLKEDVSFAGLNVEATPAHNFGARDDLVRFVVRPAADRSHYHRSQSAALTTELLGFLAGSESVQVVFAPRYLSQVTQLEELEFRNEPVVLDRPIEFVALLKAADAVVSAGGTMLREAAMLGVPAYSTFQGRRGAVDRHLAERGRLQFLDSRDDFRSIGLQKKGKLSSVSQNPMLAEEIVELVLARTSRTGADAGGLQDVS
jgi:predicted glycosyltransferase